MVETHTHGTINMYPQLDKAEQFRIERTNEKNILLQKFMKDEQREKDLQNFIHYNI